MTEAPQLQITRDANRVTVVGDVRTTADRELLKGEVHAAIADNTANHPLTLEVIVDVARAGYLDSYALPALVTLARKCADVGMVLALDGASEELLDLLSVTSIDQVLRTHGARITPITPAAA